MSGCSRTRSPRSSQLRSPHARYALSQASALTSPAWFRFGAPAAVLGIFFLSKCAGLGVAPYAVAVGVWIIASILMWASRPAEPG